MQFKMINPGKICDCSSFSRSEVARRDKVRESKRHRLVGLTSLFKL